VAKLALLMGDARSVIKRLRFPLDIMLLCVRWYVAYALSLRNLEEIMQERGVRGVFVDHSTIHRWVIKLVPVLKEAFRKRKRKRGIGAVGKSRRLDEMYVKIRSEDRYWSNQSSSANRSNATGPSSFWPPSLPTSFSLRLSWPATFS
jgi:putative transposase